MDAKKQRLAKELDTRVKYHRLIGLDDIGLLAAMSDRLLDYKARWMRLDLKAWRG